MPRLPAKYNINNSTLGAPQSVQSALGNIYKTAALRLPGLMAVDQPRVCLRTDGAGPWPSKQDISAVRPTGRAERLTLRSTRIVGCWILQQD